MKRKLLFLYLIAIVIFNQCSSWQLKKNFNKIERGMTTKQVNNVLDGNIPSDKIVTPEQEVWIFDFYNNWDGSYEGSKNVIFIKDKVQRIETATERQNATYSAIAKRRKEEAEQQAREETMRKQNERTCYCSYACDEGESFANNLVLGKDNKVVETRNKLL